MNTLTINTIAAFAVATLIVLAAYFSVNNVSAANIISGISENECVLQSGDWHKKVCVLSDNTINQNLKVSECKTEGGETLRSVCVLPEVTPEPDPDPTPPPDDPNLITCTKENQFEVCPGGSTSATGPGVCIVADGETEGYCDYLYQQSCQASTECDDFLGYDSAYVCCHINSASNRCLNPGLCRYSVEEYDALFK